MSATTPTTVFQGIFAAGSSPVLETPADRLLTRPVAPRHLLIDHDDALGPRREVAVLQQAATEKRDAHGLEVAGHDLIFGQRGSGIIRALRRLPFERDSIVRLTMDEEVADGAHGDDAGQRADPSCRLAEERGALRGRVVFVGQVHLEQQHVARVEPAVRRLHPQEAANQKTGARQQDHGERDLGHNQPLVHAAGAASSEHPRAALAEDLGGIRRGQLQGREQPGEQAAAERRDEQEQEHARIELDRVRPWQRTRREIPQGHRPRPCDQQADCSRKQRQHQVFGQRLADEPRLARAKGGAQRELVPARSRASEHEVRDVRAGNQQDEPDGSKEQPQRTLRGRSDDAIDQGIGRHAEARVRRGVLFSQPGRNRIHFGARRRDGRRRSQASQHDEGIPSAAPLVLPVRAEPQRLPELDLRIRELEPRGHHADDLDGRLLQLDRSAEHASIRAEPLPPETVADDDGAPVGAEIARLEGAAEERRRAQELEEARADLRQEDPLRTSATGQRAAGELRPDVGRHLLERRAPLLPVAKVQVGGAIGQVLADVPGPHDRDAIGVVVREVAQDDGAEDAEDGRVRPDAQRERQHGDGRKPWALQQRSETIPKISNPAVHWAPRFARGRG